MNPTRNWDFGFRTSNLNGSSRNDFVWPLSGIAKCPDFKNTYACGGGLHFLRHMDGDYNLTNVGYLQGKSIQILKVPHKIHGRDNIIDIDERKSKCRQAEVIGTFYDFKSTLAFMNAPVDSKGSSTPFKGHDFYVTQCRNKLACNLNGSDYVKYIFSCRQAVECISYVENHITDFVTDNYYIKGGTTGILKYDSREIYMSFYVLPGSNLVAINMKTGKARSIHFKDAKRVAVAFENNKLTIK